MEEIWKDIEGYEGLYQVSNLGKVKSLRRLVNHSSGNGTRPINERILKPSSDKDGYLLVILHKNGKSKTSKVHRLVAKAFIMNLNGYPIINHKDEDKTNNHANNLEWCTIKYNNNYGNKNKKASNSLKGRTIPEEIRAKMSESHKGIHVGNLSPCYDSGYKIRCIETNEVNTVRYFAEKIAKEQNKNPKSIMPDIHKCINGKRKSASGFHWIKEI